MSKDGGSLSASYPLPTPLLGCWEKGQHSGVDDAFLIL